MLKHLDDLMNYKPDEEATAPTNERLSRFYQFLEKQDYSKFFVWVDFENPELLTDFYKAPLFYEAGKYNFEFHEKWIFLAPNLKDIDIPENFIIKTQNIQARFLILKLITAN